MHCTECGFDNPDDTRFCTNCGANLEAAAPPTLPTPPTTSTNYCPQCGSEVRPEARFCDRCGQDLKHPTKRVAPVPPPAAPQAPPVIVQTPGAAPAVERAFPLPNVIAAGVGAVLMLVSLAVPWYTIRYMGFSEDVSASELLTETGNGGPIWAGSALPLILMIVFASLVLISVVYSFVARSATRWVWASLGNLCALCVIGNAVYILWWLHENTYPPEWINIVAAGSVLAFVGALVVMFSGAIGGRRT